MELNWTSFWKNQGRHFHNVMQLSTNYFASQLVSQFQLKPEDKIFDYGCGPGFLGDWLAKKNIHVTGADINAQFIHECRQNHPQSHYFTISGDPDSTKKILASEIREEKFDYIVLLSIIQYFPHTDSVSRVVELLRKHLKPKGKIIIADVVDEETVSWKDALSLLIHCIKSNKLISFVRFIFYVLFSGYKKVNKQNDLLRVSREDIQKIASANSMTAQMASGLTIHHSRKSYVLTNL